jgi:hypothetical protein
LADFPVWEVSLFLGKHSRTSVEMVFEQTLLNNIFNSDWIVYKRSNHQYFPSLEVSQTSEFYWKSRDISKKQKA